MTLQLQDLIKDTLGDLESLTPDKISNLIQEALKTFSFLKEKGESSDPRDREEAIQIATSLKESIELQTAEVSRKTGIAPSLLHAMGDDQSLFSPEMVTELKNAEEQINAFRKTLETKPTTKADAKRKKNKSNWMAG